MATVGSYPTRFVCIDVIWEVPPTVATKVYIGGTSEIMKNSSTDVETVTSGVKAKWPTGVRSTPHINRHQK